LKKSLLVKKQKDAEGEKGMPSAHEHPFLNLDTRLLVLGTRHDAILSSPADVECNLRNAATNIKSRVVGVSIETAGFTNFMRNVTPHINKMTFTTFGSDLYPDGTELVVEIEPNQYDIDSFAEALQDGFDTVYPGIIEIVVNSPAGLPKTISYKLLPAFGASGQGYITILRHKNIARVMGVNRGEVFVINQVDPVTKYPLLYGNQCVYIHSKALAGSRTSLGGHEVSDSVIGTINVDVPFGYVCQTRFADAERPTVCYGMMTPSQIENVDLSFRNADRDIIDMPGGEIFVTARLWLHSF
jgi:hypothetical protein